MTAPEVIHLASISKLPAGVFYTAYVCEPSNESAIAHFTERFGYPPARVYRWQDRAGRVTIFCELREEEKDE